MRIVVIGGTDLLGPRLVQTLRVKGHDAVAAPPCVDTFTGEGLAATLRQAAVVVDLSEPPVAQNRQSVERFATATATLLEFEIAAGVTHHVALAPVATDRLLDSHYFRARLAEEQLIRRSAVPYSIVRVTPLFESLEGLADLMTQGFDVHVPPVLVQPVAADDVVRFLASVALAAPLNRTVEIGGPEPFYLGAIVQRVLGRRSDAKRVVADANARYFGAQLDERSLLPGDEAELGEIRFDDWVRGRAPLDAHEFRVDDLPPGAVLLMGDVAVFSVAGGLCATQAYCTHRAGPLSEGAIDDNTVTCPLHGAQFNIWTGAVLRGPATAPLKTYRVVVDGEVGRVVADDRSSVPASSAV